MIEFFSPILENFAHFLYKLPRWVSIRPDGVPFCPEHHPKPIFFTQQSHTSFWEVHKTQPNPPQKQYVHKTQPNVHKTQYVHKTQPNPPQNTPSPGPNLKVGKICYSLGNLNPNWAKCLKSGQNFLVELGIFFKFMQVF